MSALGQFIEQFIQKPGLTGAIAPSSAGLAETITDWVDLDNADAVVEFGPGTGAVTSVIKRKLAKDATFFAVEINPHFVQILQKKHPDLTVYHDCIENTHKYLEQHGLTHCDCIICGLPWAAFDPEMQERLLGAVHDILKPGGQFVTFAYLQGLLLKRGRLFRHRINTRFREVTISKTVWRNLPPAFVYQATK